MRAGLPSWPPGSSEKVQLLNETILIYGSTGYTGKLIAKRQRPGKLDLAKWYRRGLILCGPDHVSAGGYEPRARMRRKSATFDFSGFCDVIDRVLLTQNNPIISRRFQS
jgi:hypothetical protein